MYIETDDKNKHGIWTIFVLHVHALYCGVVLPLEWNGYILLYFWHCMFRVLNQDVKMLRPVNLEFL